MLQECEHLGIALEVGHIFAYHVQSHEQERESYEELTYGFVAA